MLAGDHGDVATPTAVAAAGTSARNELLAAKGHAAITAVACFYEDFYFVDEQGGNRTGRSLLMLFRGANADEFAEPAAVAELYDPGYFGENGIVLTHTGILAGLKPRPALADDNGPAGYHLAAEHLHAEALRIRIAAVFRTA
jgi:hypothetical protein